MPENTVYLITGANRGIGLTLTTLLLTRPNTTIIATIRTLATPAPTLHSLPTAQNSILIILPLEAGSLLSARSLLTSLQEDHPAIAHIDVVIANAGTSTFTPTLQLGVDEIENHFRVNTIGPILLFQVLHQLLATARNPKFILVSSVLGSIGGTEGEEGAASTLAYGMSKAASNFFIRKLHCEQPKLTAIALHPGWLPTENGQNFADTIGFPAPNGNLEDSVKGMIEQIDNSSRETTSGKFVSWDGSSIPW